MDWQKELKRFRVSFEGIFHLIRHETHFQIHVFAAVLVVAMGFFCQVSIMHWVILVLCIAMVMGFEAINTSIEQLLDVLHPSHHPLIGKAKDLASAAVLLVAIAAAIVGLLVFTPYFIDRF